MKNGISKAAAKRAYHVAMYALAEEHRICKLPDNVLFERMKEIQETCFGKKDEN